MRGAYLLSTVLHNGNEIPFSPLAKEFKFRDFLLSCFISPPLSLFCKASFLIGRLTGETLLGIWERTPKVRRRAKIVFPKTKLSRRKLNVCWPHTQSNASRCAETKDVIRAAITIESIGYMQVRPVIHARKGMAS